MSDISLFVLGAAGATGRLVVQEALKKGHHVTAFVRDREKLAIQHARLDVATGDALDPRSISASLKPGQRIISCLGIGPKGPKEFHRRTAKAIVQAAHSHNVKRLVVLSTLGTGRSAHARTPFLSLMFGMMGTRWIFDDKAEQDKIFLVSGLDATIIHSALLSNGPPKKDVRLVDAKDMERPGFFGPLLPRADVANALISQAEVHSTQDQVICLSR